MHPDVLKLLELQKVDQQLAQVRKDLEALPAEEGRRRRRLEKLEARRDERKQALTEAEIESRQVEVGIKHADEEIRKLEVRLNTVRNNAEYQATLLQIDAVKRDRGRLEEEGLALLEKIEGLRAEFQQAEAAVAEERAVFQEFQAEAAKERERLERELERIGAGRERFTEGIPPDLMERYARLFEVRDGLAVCAAEGQVCTGCYTSMTTNDYARLLSGSSIVQCGSCQRILYLAE